MRTRPVIACLGAGRMGRGIAVAFAYAGHEVAILDLKPRDTAGFTKLEGEVLAEIESAFGSLSRFGLLADTDIPTLMERVSVVPETQVETALAKAAIVFEGVPEIVDLKRATLARAEAAMAPGAILASTTSTILVDDLSGALKRPERFLNAHWLNPAYLVPLVELSPGAKTDPAVTAEMKALLEGIGKVPVTCAATPGYIVPRIQVLAMNEAARMVEQGVASAEDIDKAITYGFGFRYAVLGLLEFIDWGGGDILHYASGYLTGALNDSRYAAPEIIGKNMEEGRIGMRTGQGFLDYAGKDIAAYREQRLAAIAGLLKHIGLTRPPVLD